MGGFRINGCGVTDHFKKLRSLGHHTCPYCGREAEFFLEEARQKVDVLFIPTVTLKSRHAVMCGICRQGEICSQEWAAQLMSGQLPDGMIFESKRVVEQTEAASQGAIPQPEKQPDFQSITPPSTSQPPQIEPENRFRPMSKKEIPSFFKCPQCGITQIREGNTCAYCGQPAPADPEAEQAVLSSKPESGRCPACGSIQTAGGRFCSACGHQMEPRQQEKRVCPNCGLPAEDHMLFCMECGTKL